MLRIFKGESEAEGGGVQSGDGSRREGGEALGAGGKAPREGKLGAAGLLGDAQAAQEGLLPAPLLVPLTC